MWPFKSKQKIEPIIEKEIEKEFHFGLTENGQLIIEVGNTYAYKEPVVWFAIIIGKTRAEARNLLISELVLIEKSICEMGKEHPEKNGYSIPTTFGYKKCKFGEWHKLGE